MAEDLAAGCSWEAQNSKLSALSTYVSTAPYAIAASAATSAKCS